MTETTAPTEFAARMKAIVRRGASPQIELGSTLDMDTQTAEIASEEMRLTRLQYQLLEFLAPGANSTRTKAAILTQLYLFDDEPHSRVIDAYICRIRREMTRLGADASTLENVCGRGCMLRDTAKVQVAA